MSRYDDFKTQVDDDFLRTHVRDIKGQRWIEKGSREHYEYLKRMGDEAAADRQTNERYLERLAELRVEAASEGIVHQSEFTNWMDAPGMGGVSSELTTAYIETDSGELKEMSYRKSLSRRQALNLELRAYKARLLGEDDGLDPKVSGGLDGLETKSAPTFSMKMSRTGRITGYLSTFGPPADAVGDIVERGAFKACLQRHRRSSKTVPLLWQHDPAKPIGKFLSLEEDGHGLKAIAQIDTSIEDGQRAYSGIQNGYIGGLSMGYTVTDYANDRNGTRLLKAVDLMEGSVVTFPANSNATIITVE